MRGCLHVPLCARRGGRGQVRVTNKAEYEALMDRAAYDKYLEETAH